MKDFFRRLKALTHKEFLELIRDRSSLLMGILMPMMLVFINDLSESLCKSMIELLVASQMLPENGTTIYRIMRVDYLVMP